jgi:hypothetical protein
MSLHKFREFLLASTALGLVIERQENVVGYAATSQR